METWESSDSGHRVAIRSAGEFQLDAFRYKEAGEGVSLIIGKLKDSDDSKLVVQSVVFDASNFSALEDAKQFWHENKSDLDRGYDPRSGHTLDGKGIKSLGGYSKRITSVYKAAKDEEGADLPTGLEPTDEQLVKINNFTMRPKSASEIAVIPAHACNDIIDRDLDQFSTDTVKGFMTLPEGLNPIGKSFMVGHDYTKLPVGRIFDGSTRTKDGVTELHLVSYIPNTPQHKDFLENVDYGIYWAVSVGVMVDKAVCTVGEEHDWGWWPYSCSMGHSKGSFYDPDGETDKYGYPIPTDEKSGSLCYCVMSEPSDFYELSQVFLGAQYRAEVGKVVRSARSKSKSFGLRVKGKHTVSDFINKGAVMLKAEEASQILPKVLFPADSRIAKAASEGAKLDELPDGTYKWVSDTGLVFTFEPGTDEELCLGKQAEIEDEEVVPEVSQVKDAESDNEEDDAEETPADDESEEEDTENKGVEMEKATILRVAKGTKLPASLVQRIEQAPGDGLEELVAFATEQHQKAAELAPKAVLGDTYLKELRDETIHWYTLSQRQSAQDNQKGVNTTEIESLLALCGDNAALIKQQGKLYRDLARSKFPEAVRRSTFPTNPNERGFDVGGDDEEPQQNFEIDVKGVRRIHGY